MYVLVVCVQWYVCVLIVCMQWYVHMCADGSQDGSHAGRISCSRELPDVCAGN